MDIQQLDEALAVVDGTLTLTAATLPGTTLGDLLTAYNGGAPLVVDGARKQVTDTAVELVAGTASFQNVPGVQVRGAFTLDADHQPVTSLRFTLVDGAPGPDAWRFSRSFPALPGFADDKSDGGTPPPHLLDTLALSDAAFVLTTAGDGTDAGSGVALAAGLNFVATLAPKGVVGLFGTLLGEAATVTLHGPVVAPDPATVTPPLPPATSPWDAPWAVPGIHLSADLALSVDLADTLAFDHTVLHLYCPTTATWRAANPSYLPAIAVTGRLSITVGGDAGARVEPITVDLTAWVSQSYTRMALTGAVSGVTLANLTRLAGLAGGDDLFASLPQTVQDEITQAGTALGGFGLEAVGIRFTDSLSPDTISVTVGIGDLHSELLPGFTLESISADFVVSAPFDSGRSLSTFLRGTFELGGAPFDVLVSVDDMTARAVLQESATIPLHRWFGELGLPAPADLSIDVADLTVASGGAYSIAVLMADSTPWTLDLGGTPMTVGDLELALSRDAAGEASGTFAGTIGFGDDLHLGMRYDLPGDFLVRAEFDEVKLSDLIGRLNQIGLALPDSFDIDFQQTWVLIAEQGGALTFTAATVVTDLGMLAFTARKQQQWGFAAGLDLDAGRLSAVPGLDVLEPFTSFVGLDQVLLVVSSLTDPGFQFPDMAQFQVPALAGGKVKLPPEAGGLSEGLNFYARLSEVKSKGFQALAGWLGIALDGSIAVTVGISLPDPATKSQLVLSVSEEIQAGTTVTGSLGGMLTGGEVGAFLAADVRTSVQGQPLDGKLTAAVLEGGVMVSASLQGGPIRFDPLPVQVADLGFVVGLDWEGVPSLGLAATLDVEDFEASIALFFDSENPSKSMVAGAISDLTVLDVARTLAGQSSVPAPLDEVLGSIGLKALTAFTMPISVGEALDGRDLDAVAASFQQYGKVTIPSTSAQILLVINTPGSVWHLTDRSTMEHYELKAGGDEIAVSLEPQLYCAPQDTYVGGIHFPELFKVQGELDFLLLKAQVDVVVQPSQGIAADVDVAKISVVSDTFLSVTDATGQKGPQVSLATFTQPGKADENLRPPHFLVTGMVRLLGLDVSSTYISIGAQGFHFDLAGQVTPVIHLEVSGDFDAEEVDVSGAIVVGIDDALDLGPLGTVHVTADVNGSVGARYHDGTASASFGGGFDFEGVSGTIPPVTLDVSGPALANIAETAWEQVKDILVKALKDADQWLRWVDAEIVKGIDTAAAAIGKLLSDEFGLSPDEIVAKTQQILGYGLAELSAALRGAGQSIADAANTLAQLGEWTASEIAAALSSIFGGHADVNLHIDNQVQSHIDNPGSQHVDERTGSHIDDTIKQWDGSTTHNDNSGQLPHTDVAGTPHQDQASHHQDQPDHGDNG